MRRIQLKEVLAIVFGVMVGGTIACLFIGRFVIYPFVCIAIPFFVGLWKKRVQA